MNKITFVLSEYIAQKQNEYDLRLKTKLNDQMQKHTDPY